MAITLLEIKHWGIQLKSQDKEQCILVALNFNFITQLNKQS